MGENRIASIGNGILAATSGLDVVKRQEEAGEVMFADMISMSVSSNTDDFTTDVSDEMLETVEADGLDSRRENPTDAYEKYQYKDKTIRTETSDSEVPKEEAVAEVKEFEEAVTEVISEELHVSQEELEAAMEELGLTYLDLLDRNNLANVVAKLTGCENMNQLLCNEAFTVVLQKVGELGNELLQGLKLTPEEFVEFQAVLEEMTNPDAKTQEVPENVSATDAKQTEADSTVIADDVTEEQPVWKPEGQTLQDAVEDDGKVKVVRMKEPEEKPVGDFKEQLSEGEQEFTGADTKQPAQVLQANENVAINHTQATFEAQLGEMDTVQTLPPHVSVADIMEQFVEQARVTITAETTKMAMQLNPEHLGKLYVEIIENEGVITAKLQTQNALVKEALEMQMADLKVNLNQAGVKVDSVEVTVASHEFERNLEQDANSKKQQEEAQEKATRHHSINLNALDELSGIMTEEETLVAKMMAEQGNSVDFTA